MANDRKTTESRPVESVMVSVMSTGDGSRLLSGTEAKTFGAYQPNLVVQMVRPATAIAIRFTNTFLTVLLGVLAGSMSTDVIPAGDFLDLVRKCAGLSVAGAGVGLLKDLITIFGRLEQKNPLLTGNV